MAGEHDGFMRRALELAARAAFTSPNPRVGAVFVRGGEVIGEGWHQAAGGEHAEAAVLMSTDVSGAILYVNLEPCIHHGRTPPCAPALVDAGVSGVVIAHEDPDARVRGRGVAFLREHGVDVVSGVLADDALRLNAPYIHHRFTGRSFVTLKLALSLDGRLTAPDGSSRWITGEGARARVHARRAEVDAVMVGAGTVAADDPRLSARHPGVERQPARVLVDATGSIPSTAAAFGGGDRVIVATTDRSPHDVQTSWKEAGAEVVVLAEEASGVDLRALLRRLGRDGIIEVMCEGGARLATSLLREDLVERLELYLAPIVLGGGGDGLGDVGVNAIGEARRWRIERAERIDEDLAVVLQRARGGPR